jgi:hypothetical protein
MELGRVCYDRINDKENIDEFVHRLDGGVTCRSEGLHIPLPTVVIVIVVLPTRPVVVVIGSLWVEAATTMTTR